MFLIDRLTDLALKSKSVSLYCVRNVRVMAVLIDMADFFDNILLCPYL